MNMSDKNYLNSPVPILASYLEVDSTGFCTKWRNTGKSRIHVNLDTNEIVCEMFEVYLARLLSEQNLLENLAKVQSMYKEEKIAKTGIKPKHDKTNMKLVLSLQVLHLIRNAISVIFLKDFDKKLLDNLNVDIEEVKNSILGKSKLGKKEHKELLDSQIFSYFFENVCQLKNDLETSIF